MNKPTPKAIETDGWRQAFQDAKRHFSNAEWRECVATFRDVLVQYNDYLPSAAKCSIHRRLSEAYLVLAELEEALVQADLALVSSTDFLERDYMRKSRVLEFMGRFKETRSVLIECAENYLRQKSFRQSNDIVNIVVISLPKSGSTSISASISAQLGYDHIEFPNRQGTSLFSNSVPVIRCYKMLQNAGIVMHSHLKPLARHIRLLSNLSGYQYILHVRDPREALVSALNMVHRQNTFQILKRNPALLELPLTKQVDWMIAHYLPTQVNWIAGWLKAIDSNPQLMIQMSLFSEMKSRGQDVVAHELVVKLGLSAPASPVSTLPRRFKDRIVKGGWRELFNSRQQKAACAAMPELIYDKLALERY